MDPKTFIARFVWVIGLSIDYNCRIVELLKYRVIEIIHENDDDN